MDSRGRPNWHSSTDRTHGGVSRAIRKKIATRALILGLFREDVREYPFEFLREALLNAIVHRDYSPLARGSAVQVKIFPHCFEIENPGGLFGPVTEERLGGRFIVPPQRVPVEARPRRPDRREEIARLLREHGTLSAVKIAAQD